MRRKQVAQGVTTARRSPKEDRDARLRTYLIAMAIRTVSFPLAVWALLSDWIIVGLVLAAAATFLPQFAATLANAIDNRTTGGGSPLSPTLGLPTSDSQHLPENITDDIAGDISGDIIGDATTDQEHDAHL